jgi:sigma-B regulation protein RsbU (phosphoserine phosphatase)
VFSLFFCNFALVKQKGSILKWFQEVLRNKVVLNIILAAIVLELISFLQFYYVQQMLADELEERAESEITIKAIVIKSTLNLSENSLLGHIQDMERSLETPDSLYSAMEWVLRSHPNLVGCWAAFVPNYYPEKGRFFEPYVYWDNGDIGKKQIASENHDYTQSVYFEQVISTNVSVWLDPYVDEITGKRMVSYAVPIRDKNKNVVAVFGLDVSTTMLGDTLNYRHIYGSSFDLLLTKNGQLIAGPNERNIKHSDVANIVNTINDSTIAKQTSKNGNSRIATFYDPDDNEKGYVYYTCFKDKPEWQIAVVCYDDELFGKLRNTHLTILLTTLVGLIVLGFIISYFIKNNQKLAATKKAKERIDSELRIASNIQMQMLPNQELLAKRDDIDIYGSLLPAREVGGDLYDYFIRDEKLFFCIGDVSGKGVPAAIHMAGTHAWFRAVSNHQRNPARIMQAINETLCERNESNMFITLFIGVLDLPTGHLCYCNAGHDAPIIIDNGQFTMDNSQLSIINCNPNLPVGVFDNVKYEMQETTLASGATIFLYTDGLTEAMNMEHKQFGIDRVMSLLNGATELTPRLLLGMMNMEVHSFADGIEQSDDLTMLAIRYTPQQFESTFAEELTMKNDVHEVTRFSSFMKSVIERLDIEKSLGRQLRLAVEEAVVNVINYAYPADTEGDVTVRMMSDGETLQCQIIDSGIPFDPTEKEKADITLSAAERQVGGLGILLVRELMDSINYERSDDKNILTLTKKLQK